jgi:tetratricopeptide (TPR) repeat protein
VESRQLKRAILTCAADLTERQGEDARAIWTRILEIDGTSDRASRALERIHGKSREHGPLLACYLQRAKAARGILRAHFLMRIATVYEEMGRVADACEILEKILSLEPGFHLARFELARLARSVGAWDTAVLQEEALAQSAPTPQRRVQHLTGAAEILSERLGETERAIPILREVIGLDPENDDAFAQLRAYYTTSDTAEDRSGLLDIVCQRLRVATDSDARAMLLADAVDACGDDLERTRGFVKELLKLRPSDPRGLAVATELALRDTNPFGARRLLERRLELPGCDRAHLLRQIARISRDDLDDPEAAREALSELVSIEPNDIESQRALAGIDDRLGDHAKAVARYREIFEHRPSADLAQGISDLLHLHIGHPQEALSWSMRALDLEPSHATATQGFLDLIVKLDTEAPHTVRVRVIQDRLDGLVRSHRAALQLDPWDLGRLVSLTQLCRLRGETSRERELAGAIAYFGLADDRVRATIRDHSTDSPALLSASAPRRLSENSLREHLLVPEAKGLRRQVLALVWDVVANADPSDLSDHNVTRDDRMAPKDLERRLNNLASTLQIFGIEFYEHRTKPYAVIPVLAPTPCLIVGQAIFESENDPVHHFRVARAMEQLRDGKLLLDRADAHVWLHTLDLRLQSTLGPLMPSPLFSADGDGTWSRKASLRLQKGLNRRLRRELRTAFEGATTPTGQREEWIEETRQIPVRMGLAVCGEFGVAADAVIGTNFYVSPERGRARKEDVLQAARKNAQTESRVAGLIRLISSEGWAPLRDGLVGQKTGDS